MTARLQGKISKHAGIPNSAPCSFTKQGVITNVKAVTGRANKSTDTAAEAGGRHLCPEISVVKDIFQFFRDYLLIESHETRFIFLAFIDIFSEIFLVSSNSIFKNGKLRQKIFPFFRNCLKQ